MTTPGTLNDGKPITYGFGLGTGTLRGHRQVSHDGGINGFVAEVHHYTADSVVTVVLTNTSALVAIELERLIACGDRARTRRRCRVCPDEAVSHRRACEDDGEYSRGLPSSLR